MSLLDPKDFFFFHFFTSSHPIVYPDQTFVYWNNFERALGMVHNCI